MAYAVQPAFVIGGVYHIYNRGVAKQPVFLTQEDFERFLLTLGFYLEVEPPRRLSMIQGKARRVLMSTEPSRPLVEILAYCLMPNHFHLIVRQLEEHGISTFMSRVLNSYTKAFNARHHRVGHLFQGTFQAVAIETDEQLLHATRYLHLNPYVARLVDVPGDYMWSSYPLYLQARSSRLCHSDQVLEMSGGVEQYQEFVEDYANYARDLHVLKDLLLDVNS